MSSAFVKQHHKMYTLSAYCRSQLSHKDPLFKQHHPDPKSAVLLMWIAQIALKCCIWPRICNLWVCSHWWHHMIHTRLNATLCESDRHQCQHLIKRSINNNCCWSFSCLWLLGLICTNGWSWFFWMHPLHTFSWPTLLHFTNVHFTSPVIGRRSI